MENIKALFSKISAPFFSFQKRAAEASPVPPSIDLLYKSMSWFLYDRDPRHGGELNKG